MAAEKTYAIDENQITHNDFGDEVVVIHFETGNYYSLRETAAWIWKGLVQGPLSASSATGMFHDPPVDARDKIRDFLADLQTRGILVEAGPETAQSAGVPIGEAEFTAIEFEAYEDLQALLVADVIHDTDERGWPHMAPGEAA